MFGFRKRLTSQGITWEQLAFQFVIILLGVYLAIALERWAEERGREEDAREMLTRVVDELRLDEAEIELALARADTISGAFDTLFALMSEGTNRDGERIDSLLDGPLFYFPTVFPRRAAYSALVSGGYLTAISDQDLAVSLADLYENRYARLMANNDFTDQNYMHAFLAFTGQWDLDRHVFLNPGPAGTAVARNAMRNIKENYVDWYAGFLLTETLASVIALRTDLESHLGR